MREAKFLEALANGDEELLKRKELETKSVEATKAGRFCVEKIHRPHCEAIIIFN